MTQALVSNTRLAALVCEAVDTLLEGFATLGPDHTEIYAYAPSWAHHVFLGSQRALRTDAGDEGGDRLYSLGIFR